MKAPVKRKLQVRLKGSITQDQTMEIRNFICQKYTMTNIFNSGSRLDLVVNFSQQQIAYLEDYSIHSQQGDKYYVENLVGGIKEIFKLDVENHPYFKQFPYLVNVM